MSFPVVLITHSNSMPSRAVFAAAVLGETTAEGMVWLDVNFFGSRLPQMYWPSEFTATTPELAANYELCAPCRGYGLLAIPDPVFNPPRDQIQLCPQCFGSGSTRWKRETTTESPGHTAARLTEQPPPATGTPAAGG